MWKHHGLIIECWFNNVKIVKQGAEGHGTSFAKYEISHVLQWPWTWVYFQKISSVTSLTIAAKASHTTSCEAILSPLCSQWKRCNKSSTFQVGNFGTMTSKEINLTPQMGKKICRWIKKALGYNNELKPKSLSKNLKTGV